MPRNRRQGDLETEEGSGKELVTKSGVAWRQRTVIGGAGQSEGVSDQERGCLETEKGVEQGGPETEEASRKELGTKSGVV